MVKEKIDKRVSICMILLGLIAILSCNTNNNPDALITRLIPPYQSSTSSIMIGNIIVLIFLPFILFDLYRRTKWHFLNSVPKRLLCSALFLVGCSYISEPSIQVIKAFQTDLDAIYLDREQMSASCEWETIEEEGVRYYVYDGKVYITLKNCSKREVQNFKIKLYIEKINDDHSLIENIIEPKETYSLQPNETSVISLLEFKDLRKATEEGYSSGQRNYGIDKITLYNDEMSVDFIKPSV